MATQGGSVPKGGDPLTQPMPELDAARAAAIAEMVLACVHREFPVHLNHVMTSGADARPARELTPAFYGSFDWHSSVHGHWSLVRLARLVPLAPWCEPAVAAVSVSLAPDRVAGELAYLEGEGRQGFERPYGLAWLLQLAAEVREWAHGAAPGDMALGTARRWLEALVPLESLAAERLTTWLARLPWPVRGGEHSQSAFALGLVLDWTRASGREDVSEMVRRRARDLYASDHSAPVAYEPSGHDFLSPTLAEADLMRRVMNGGAYVEWVERFLPEPESATTRRWLEPVTSPDRTDGKLSHLDGLNLSRAWMLDGIASVLPDTHPWRGVLARASRRHAEAGLAWVPADHYAGMHWLGSFAVYALTRRGLAESFVDAR